MKKCKLLILLLCVLSSFFGQAQTSSPVIVNEVGIMPTTNTKYIELLVTGSSSIGGSAAVDLEGWIVDNNTENIIADSIFTALGAAFNGILPGTLILIYDQENPHPNINVEADGLPNSNGVYQLSFNSPELNRCVKGAAYDCGGSTVSTTNSWHSAFPLVLSGDVVQLRAPNQALRQAVSWTTTFSDQASVATTAIDLTGSVTSSLALKGQCESSKYQYDGTTTTGTPGKANSSGNKAFIRSFTGTPLPPIVQMEGEGIAATNGANGQIELLVSDGLVPYAVTWTGPSSGEMNVANTGAYTFTGFATGTYAVKVVDALGCVDVVEVFVPTEVSTPALQISCSSQPSSSMNDGIIEVTLSYGVAPYTIQWSDGTSFGEMDVMTAGTVTIPNLGIGTYTVTGNDSNGNANDEAICTTTIIEQVLNEQICGGGCINDIGAEASCFQWEPTDGLEDIYQSITNACPTETTEYILTIVDSENGEILEELSYLIEVQDIGLSIYPENPSLCAGSTVILSGETWIDNEDFEYVWSNGETSPAIEADIAGVYSVTVTEPTTMCQEVAEVEVTALSTATVEMVSSADNICEGGSVQLDALVVPASGNYSFLWSTGDVTPSISVMSSGDFSVTVTNTDTDCEAIADFNLPTNDITVEITSSAPVICPTGTVSLSVENIYANYEWSTGVAGPSLNSITITNFGSYSVTVTDVNGCIAQSEITIGDASSAAGVRSFFEDKGFYAIPIAIQGPAFGPSGSGEKDAKALQSDLCVDGDACDGVTGFCSQDYASLEISIQGDPIPDLKYIIDENLSYFETEFGYTNPRAYITSNDQICSCANYLDLAETAFEADGLRYWVHLWQSDNAGEDLMFVLANVPTDDAHYPKNDRRRDFLTSGLDLIYNTPDYGNFNSKGEQVAFVLQDLMLDNHMNDSPHQNGQGSLLGLVCEDYIASNIACLAPSAVPVQLPESAVLRFGINSTWEDDITQGVLTAFTELLDDGTANYYQARGNISGPLPGGNFRGYYKISRRGTIIGETPYLSPTILSILPKVVIGTVGQYANGGLYYDLEKWTYTSCSTPVVPTTGAGPIVSDYSECLGSIVDETTYNIDLPAISGAEFASAEQASTLWENGVLIKVAHENGYDDYIYGEPNLDTTDPSDLIYYRWNCITGEWEPYTPDDAGIINTIENGIIANEYDETEETGEEGVLTDPVCFSLEKGQLPFYSINPNSISLPIPTGLLRDYGGLNATTKNEIQKTIDIAQQRWELKMQYVLSADGQPGGELPIDSWNPASVDFYNLNLSREDPNDPDLIMWMHYGENGATLCIRFADDFFEYNTHNYEYDAEEVLKTKAILVDAIRESIGKSYLDLIDGNSTNDLDPVDPLPPPVPGAPSPKPWRFGLKPQGELDNLPTPETVNFYSITKEIIGIGGLIVKKTEIPEKLWKIDGDCMMDTPGGVMAVGQTIAEENPLVGIAQLSSFGLSFVKDEQVRNGISEALKSPIKTAQGIYEAKKTAYSDPDIEVRYYHAGVDGTTIVIAIVTGGVLTIIDYVKGLGKKADDTANQLADELGDIPTERGGPEYDDFHEETNNLEVSSNPDIDEPEEFFGFLGGIDPIHRAKFTRHTRLITVWNSVRKTPGMTDAKLKKIVKKLPDPDSPFYDDLFDVIMDGDELIDAIDVTTGLPFNKAEFLFKDMAIKNGELLDAFKVAPPPNRLKSYDILLSRGPTRKLKRDVPTLDKMDELFNDSEFMLKFANGSTDAAVQLEEFKKIFTSVAGSKSRFNPRCSKCGNGGAKYLKESTELLEDIKKVVKEYSDLDGGEAFNTLVKQGSQGDFDEFAQTARKFSENPVEFAAGNIDNIGQTFPNSNKKYDFKFLLNGRFVELKSYAKKSIQGNGVIKPLSQQASFQPSGQFGEYLKNISSLQDFNYSFDKRKLLKETGGHWDTIGDAEAVIKDQFEKLFNYGNNKEEFFDKMTPELRLDLEIDQYTDLTPAKIDQIINGIIKIE